MDKNVPDNVQEASKAIQQMTSDDVWNHIYMANNEMLALIGEMSKPMSAQIALPGLDPREARFLLMQRSLAHLAHMINMMIMARVKAKQAQQSKPPRSRRSR